MSVETSAEAAATAGPEQQHGRGRAVVGVD